MHLGVSCGDPFLAAQFSRDLAGAAGAGLRARPRGSDEPATAAVG